ncbi:translational activator of GCN4, partial [Cladochytrium tenue]
GDAAVADVRETLRVLLENVDADGVHSLMPILADCVGTDSTPARRRAACWCLAAYCSAGAAAAEFAASYADEWIARLIGMLRGPPAFDAETVAEAWAALDAAARTVSKDRQEEMVRPIRRALATAAAPGRELPGLCLPKGISPLLPFFLQGLVYGSAEARAESAGGLGDLVRWTSPEALKPFVTQITGPLIRVIGDRFPPAVKAAILDTLGLLLTRVPALLKPFLPQLQRTFIKSLAEPAALVRGPARLCLRLLVRQQPRLDPLVAELVAGVRAAEDRGVRAAMWDALRDLAASLGGARAVSDASRRAVETLALERILGSGENDGK